MVSLPVAVSYRCYRVMLLFYPRAFRREYSREMALVFRDCCRDAHRSGEAGWLLRVWRPALVDLIANLIKEHVVGRARPRALTPGPWRTTLRCAFCSEEICPGSKSCPYCGGVVITLATRRAVRPQPRDSRRPAGYLMVRMATNAQGFFDWAHGEPGVR